MDIIQSLQLLAKNPWFLVPVLIWTLIWKGTALWKCGRNNQLYWFIALLVINTVGLLEIGYILWFQRNRNK